MSSAAGIQFHSIRNPRFHYRCMGHRIGRGCPAIGYLQFIASFLSPVLSALPAPWHSRQLAKILLLLAPAALLAGLTLRWTRPARPPLAIEYRREQWIERSRLTAHSAGLEASEWASAVRVEQDETAVRNLSAGVAANPLRAHLQPSATVIVRLRPPNADGVFETHFGPAGDLLSWSADNLPGPIQKPDESPTPSPQALAALNAWLEQYGTPSLEKWKRWKSDDDAGPRFEADLHFKEAPADKYRVEIKAPGDRLRAASIHAQFATGSTVGISSVLEQILLILGRTLTGFFALYSLRLFRRRRREGEIPQGRALVLITVFGLCGFIFIALNPDSLTNWIAVLAGLGNSLLFLLGGLFVSAAYASGEGEIREGWPGKLTAFDALLSGKWLTKSVGISAVLAFAIAAWAFFIVSAAWSLGPPQAAVLIDKDLLALALGRNVFLRSLVDLPLRVSFLIVAGLFMPLAFVHRRRWQGWKRWTALLLCPLLVDAGLRTFFLGGIGPVATLLGMASVIAGSFYLGDVLAAVLGALLYSALTSMAAIAAAVPAVSGIAASLLAAVTLATIPMMVAAWRGREVDELGVRPKYARNLAERLSMKAEATAAREAQLRLLPVKMPVRRDLSVAAYCQPAGVVGGDFYDFFASPAERLGVFVASGSGLGMASALTIALAKGFLGSEVNRGENPDTSLQALLTILAGRVGAAAERTGLLLMVLHPAGGEIRIARRGAFPAVWLIRGRDCGAIELVRAGTGSVETATVSWHPGDVLLAHTEGLTDLLDDQSPSGQRRWFEAMAKRTQGQEADRIELDLLSRLGGRKRKRLRTLRRDLTTVVLRNRTE